MLSIMSLWPSICSFRASLNVLESSFAFTYRSPSMMLLKPRLKLSESKVVFVESLVATHNDSRMLKCE